MFSQSIFSDRLIELRRIHNISQAQIANILSISQSAVSKMEKKERAASIEILCALADFYDVSLDYLVGRSDIPERR